MPKLTSAPPRVWNTFDGRQRRSEIVQVMEEDLVAVGVGRNARYVAVGFAADPFGRMGFLKELEGRKKRLNCQRLQKDKEDRERNTSSEKLLNDGVN